MRLGESGGVALAFGKFSKERTEVQRRSQERMKQGRREREEEK